MPYTIYDTESAKLPWFFVIPKYPCWTYHPTRGLFDIGDRFREVLDGQRAWI